MGCFERHTGVGRYPSSNSPLNMGFLPVREWSCNCHDENLCRNQLCTPSTKCIFTIILRSTVIF